MGPYDNALNAKPRAGGGERSLDELMDGIGIVGSSIYFRSCDAEKRMNLQIVLFSCRAHLNVSFMTCVKPHSKSYVGALL